MSVFLKHARPEYTEKGLEVASTIIEGFLRAGGHVTATEWARMDPEEQGLMVDLRKKIDLEDELRAHLPGAIEEYAKSLPEADRDRFLTVAVAKLGRIR